MTEEERKLIGCIANGLMTLTGSVLNDEYRDNLRSYLTDAGYDPMELLLLMRRET